MLYLLHQKNENKVKVGYSSQRGRNGILARMKQYKTHNPSFICRSYCRGSRADEKHCHNILYELGTKEKGSEWVEVSKELYDELYTKGMGYFYNKIPISFLEE
jgi:hypothetical protein